MSVRDGVGVLPVDERPVSLVGLLPERAEARRRLGEWLRADPVEVAAAAPVLARGDLGELAAALNAAGGPVVFVDRWAASTDPVEVMAAAVPAPSRGDLGDLAAALNAAGGPVVFVDRWAALTAAR